MSDLPAFAELEENLTLFDDNPDERYAYIIDLGKALPPLPDALKTDANKVRGCISQVWLVADRSLEQPSRLSFRADSDSVIVKGLAAVLLSLYSGKTPQEILAIDLPAVFARLKLDQHISPNRRNGFFSMVERIRKIASEAE